jgi:hypothetical protein
MESCDQFYSELQNKQRELHAKLKTFDDTEPNSEKAMKALHKKLETIDKLITLVLKYIYDNRA